MCIIEMVDNPRIVNINNAIVDLVGETEDTFPVHLYRSARSPVSIGKFNFSKFKIPFGL
jgi:hypothetical protein